MFVFGVIWTFPPPPLPKRTCKSDVGATVGNEVVAPTNRDDKNKVLWVSLSITVIALCIGGLFLAGAVWLMNILSAETDDHPFTFEVDSLALTSMTFPNPNNSITSNPIDAQFNLTLTVMTKEAKLFKMLETTIEYDNQVLSSTNIVSFHQDSLSLKTLHLQMSTDAQVKDSVIWKLAGEGSLLDLSVYVRGQYWSLDNQVNNNTCNVIMVCEGVTLTLSYAHNIWTGSTKQGPFPCKYTSNDHCVA